MGKQKFRVDNTLRQAVEMAKEAAIELAGADSVGDHLGFVAEGERLGSHRFTCLDAGYRGWYWCVTITRVPRARLATVCEVTLQPGDDALLAPDWVPWAKRLRPEDLGPGDELPYIADDERLVAQAEPDPNAAGESNPDARTGERQEDQHATDTTGGEVEDAGKAAPAAIQRRRVLSVQGRAEAAERWYAGDFGPRAQRARRAAAHCNTCGFLLALAGSTRTMFGVCANAWSPADGHVVSLDHGCGAHSETDVQEPGGQWQQSEPVINEMDIDIIAAAGAN